MSPLLSDEPRIRGTYMALRERSRGMKEVLQKVEESYLPDMLHIQRADMKKRHMYGRQRAKEMRERRLVQQHCFFFFFFAFVTCMDWLLFPCVASRSSSNR
ncbi:unnamed protein product [Sphagnum jensenii]